MHIFKFTLLFFYTTVFYAQQTNIVDFLTATAVVSPDLDKKQIEGKIDYSFKVLKDIKSFYIDAQKMKFESIKLDKKIVDFEYNDTILSIKSPLRSGTEHTLSISYLAKPKKALYFLKDTQGNHQVWTQGQGKYTSNWLPSFDDVNEKVIFDIAIEAPQSFEVTSNGKLIKTKRISKQKTRWYFDMKHPMSSYLLAFTIGVYRYKRQISKKGIPIYMYYYPTDSLKFESTYKKSTWMLDFLEKEIGFDYPWQNYKQIPVKDFLYAGMENTGNTIFSDAFMVDSIAFKDQNYINVNAHELAHQWFGNLVTASESKHHWLQEGFATYFALLVEKEIFGDDYFLFKLYETAEQLTQHSDLGKATSLLDPKASSLTFYQRGAWVLFALRDLIGDTSFKIALHNYIDKFKFKTVTTDDFFKIIEEVSGKDLTEFRVEWLENISFPSDKALALLTKYDFIKQYLDLAKERTQPLAGKWDLLNGALEVPVNDYLGQEVVYQLIGDNTQEASILYEKAFNSKNVFVRQAIATTMNSIPATLKVAYESLLIDPSYATIEAALFHLWSNYPEERIKYLDQTKTKVGFNDKNIRMLWLVLALSTKSYQTENHQQFYEELSEYTSPKYHFRIRDNAFTYLESMQFYSEKSLLNLVEGAVHHQWRFRKKCRKILDSLLTNPKYRAKYLAIKSKLPTNQQQLLEKKLTL